jgi:hypothetical protein
MFTLMVAIVLLANPISVYADTPTDCTKWEQYHEPRPLIITKEGTPYNVTDITRYMYSDPDSDLLCLVFYKESTAQVIWQLIGPWGGSDKVWLMLNDGSYAFKEGAHVDIEPTSCAASQANDSLVASIRLTLRAGDKHNSDVIEASYGSIVLEITAYLDYELCEPPELRA